jgi:hypothetical protein
MAMIRIYLIAVLLLTMTPCFAQIAGDSIPSPLKTMSYKQYKAYLDGDDYDHMARVADLNHYPSAERTLELKKQLALTAEQWAKISAINIELIRKKKEMGRFMIKNERALDSLFRIKKIDEGNLAFLANRTGLYLGELRIAILATEQKKKYLQLAKP